MNEVSLRMKQDIEDGVKLLAVAFIAISYRENSLQKKKNWSLEVRSWEGSSKMRIPAATERVSLEFFVLLDFTAATPFLFLHSTVVSLRRPVCCHCHSLEEIDPCKHLESYSSAPHDPANFISKQRWTTHCCCSSTLLLLSSLLTHGMVIQCCHHHPSLLSFDLSLFYTAVVCWSIWGLSCCSHWGPNHLYLWPRNRKPSGSLSPQKTVNKDCLDIYTTRDEECHSCDLLLQQTLCKFCIMEAIRAPEIELPKLHSSLFASHNPQCLRVCVLGSFFPSGITILIHTQCPLLLFLPEVHEKQSPSFVVFGQYSLLIPLISQKRWQLNMCTNRYSLSPTDAKGQS